MTGRSSATTTLMALANVELRVPMRHDNVFLVASLAKIFVATALSLWSMPAEVRLTAPQFYVASADDTNRS